MLDFFTIFGKGGIVLWCFQGTSQLFTPSVNALIKSVILQERGGNTSFNHEALTLKYKLDNEFELVFVVAYQKILQLSYVDKFLSDIQLEFRNKYKDELRVGNISCVFDFSDDFHHLLSIREQESKQVAKAPRQMRTFEDSKKSQKTVSSMIENKGDDKKGGKGKENKTPKGPSKQPAPVQQPAKPAAASNSTPVTNGNSDEDYIMRNRQKMFERMNTKKTVAKKSPSSETAKKKGKAPREWEGAGKNVTELDFSQPLAASSAGDDSLLVSQAEQSQVGKMREIGDFEVESESEGEEEVAVVNTNTNKSSGSSSFGMFSAFKSLVGSKTLTREDMEPALLKMRDHVIGKNVATDIAEKLCDSVAAKLEGKVLGTFSSVASTVRSSLQEACIQILTPRRRVDILRDALEAKQKRLPYVITFCGVNGVGKSTNLAKICFWLVENNLRVLIAACDTFRAGAVEQLRTHTRKLNALHPPSAHGGQQMVQLYEKGYGKDAAGIALEAINYARDSHIDVVLVDTAGRMQDNEPLMRALTKLIKVNQPDLVLFVGEALVGNEAVDQLTKFNKALADHSQMTVPRLIDGIILTKFDTIDDKVGAAISMTYTTGQPIVFVGTGQTYSDLKNLNAKAVVQALLRA